MDVAWSKLSGRFVVFDGPDGSGKSTQFRRAVSAAQAAGLAVCAVREPGGTAIGEAVRRVLLDPALGEMDATCEMLLYMASRAQLVREVIGPALQRGELVLADRFVSSTLAYQGTAGGVSLRSIHSVAGIACGDVRPDLVVVFDVDGQTAANRMAAGRREQEFTGADHDRIEAKGAAFHGRVRRGYLDQAATEPERYAVIDASTDEEAVWSSLVEALSRRLGA